MSDQPVDVIPAPPVLDEVIAARDAWERAAARSISGGLTPQELVQASLASSDLRTEYGRVLVEHGLAGTRWDTR